jgi:hypothetical protein
MTQVGITDSSMIQRVNYRSFGVWCLVSLFSMSKHEKLVLHNKKTSRSVGRSAMAVHGSVKDGHPTDCPVSYKTPAKAFLDQLKTEIRKAVK